jgi:hypothetical protein
MYIYSESLVRWTWAAAFQNGLEALVLTDQKSPYVVQAESALSFVQCEFGSN